MRKSKKKLALAVAACALSLTLAFGGTLAYMTDTEGATNTMTVGRVHIELEEPGYPGNDSDEVKNIIPNQEVVKDPQIENTGNNDALVFLRVEVPQEEFTELDANNNVGEKKLQDLFKLKGLSENWELIKTETSTDADGKTKTSYVYGYKKTLAKNSTTDKLFQKVQMKNSIENDLEGNVEDIIITAGAIQATDIPDVDLTPGSDGTMSKDVLDQVYTIFMNQSGDQKSRPADEGDKPQDGSIGKITYELNGGTITGAKKSYTTADYGYIPPEPVKSGFRFIGWTPESIPAESTGNLTFTAEWEPMESTALLLPGEALNIKMKALAGDKSPSRDSANNTVKAIHHSENAPSGAIMQDDAHVVSADNSGAPIYMWYENNTLNWWSETDDVYADYSLWYACSGMTALTDISGLADWNIENTTSINNLFDTCTSLTDLTPLKNWNTEKLDGLGSTFRKCTALQDLSPLANWNTSNVVTIGSMFSGCTSLKDLTPLSNWNTRSVIHMDSMFIDCTSLIDLSPIRNWNTKNVTDMMYTFCNCSALTSTGILNWDVSNVTTMRGVFLNCFALHDISGLKSWKPDKNTDISYMFCNCYPLADLTPIADWDVSGVIDMQATFYGCTSLQTLSGLESWNTGNVTNMKETFWNCNQLTDVSAIKEWDISNVTDFEHMCANVPIRPIFSKRPGVWDTDGTFTPTV